tara:strand:+ start:158 stop:463 length:306 start_codon:yes stop_codon:yes gene_type:complete
MITRNFFYEKENGEVETVKLSTKEQAIIKDVEKRFFDTPKIASQLFLQETGFYDYREVLDFIDDESISVYQIFCNHTQNDYQAILDVVKVFNSNFSLSEAA